MQIEKSTKKVLMLCTAGRGGMRSVVESYRDDGLFDTWNVQLIFTHDEGGWGKKMYMFLKAISIYCFHILFSEISLVHVHSAMRGSFWRKNVFSAFARLKNIPVILHLHGSEMKSFYSESSSFEKRLISNILRKADVVMVLSESWSEFIKRISPSATVEVVHNYVSIPGECAESLNDGVVRILFLGLLGKRKGIYDLIQVAERLRNNKLKFLFWVGGNGEIDKVNELIKKHELTEHFEMLGWIDKGQKKQYLAKSDIFILPSYNEGLPMSLLEAMSWQLPVVSTTVGGIPELIRDGLDGLLTEPGDLDKIESALKELIISEMFRQKLGRNAKRRIESGFSKDIVHPQINNLYSRIGNW